MSTSIPKTSGIYKIVCTANGKYYIGSAKNLFLRWNKHRSELRNNKHFNSYLQRAWNKYGENAFVFEVLELVMPWSRIDRENYWLKQLKPYNRQIGFNAGMAADNGMTGRKHTAESRAKMSSQAVGRKHSSKSRERMSAHRKGLKKSPEHKAKISNAHLGMRQSPEVLAKIANTLSKNYIVISPDGQEIRVRNLNQFCKGNGLSQGHMSSVACGKETHYKGWRCYHDEDE